MSKQYNYFIFYRYTDADGTGTGNVDVRRHFPIVRIEDIRSIESDIKDKFNYDTIVVTNWRRFEQPE